MSPRDHDAERRKAAIEAERERLQRERILPPDPDLEEPLPLTTSANGRRRWWQEVWGKVLASVLTLVTSAALVWAWGKAEAAAEATRELYELPPIVKQHSQQLEAHNAQLKAIRDAGALPPDVVEDIRTLAKAIRERNARDARGKRR